MIPVALHPISLVRQGERRSSLVRKVSWICRGKWVLKNPSNQEVCDCIGLNEGIDTTTVRDVIAVGAGPAALSSAVYAAPEEQHAIRHEFLMTGASPNTAWLNGCVSLDDKDFIRTGIGILSP